MLTDPPDVLLALPNDELAMRVLADLVTSAEWSEYNYLRSVGGSDLYGRRQDVQHTIASALGWLHSRVLIAFAWRHPGDTAIFVTPAGHAALQHGLDLVRASQQLQEGLHPLIEGRSRRQFLLGEYEQAVFVAMKAVEVRVRALAGLADEDFGVSLMNRAFGVTGPLTDTGAAGGEQEGMRALFTGAYAVLRNPAGHREIDYDDVAEAAEAVLTASLLMRILDRVERRLGSQATTV